MKHNRSKTMFVKCMGVIALILLSVSDVLAKPALLFILDGQSNAAPHASGDIVNGSWKQIVADTLINPQLVRNRTAATFADAWIPANPYPMTSQQFDIATSGFGPELSFIKTLKPNYPNHIIAVAQRALGGTSIVAWDNVPSTPAWNEAMRQTHGPSQLPKPPQYPELMDLKQQAVTTLSQKDGVSSVIMAGVLWAQNEQDVGRNYGATNYEANLRKLIQNVRRDWNAPELPFMFVNTHTHNGSTNANLIDQAVAQVQATVPHTAVVNTKDLPTHEGTHYNTAGTIELGIRYAQAYQEITEGITPPTPTPGPISTPTPLATPTPNPNPWDLNEDGVVNILDYSNFVKRVLNDRLEWNDVNEFKLALAQP